MRVPPGSVVLFAVPGVAAQGCAFKALAVGLLEEAPAGDDADEPLVTAIAIMGAAVVAAVELEELLAKS